MEGPSLYLAEKQLQPFKGKKVLEVSGNSKIGIERLLNQKVGDIFSWGKHLVFQFDDFAIRVHFMLFGTFEAEIEGEWVTGDYRRTKEPRLALNFENGQIKMYNCSIKLFEDPAIKQSYDFSSSIMSEKWNSKQAFSKVKKQPDEEIADMLLDQDVFAGVGNMIKNEVLSIVKVNPKRNIKDIEDQKLKEIIEVANSFSWQFYKWRQKFELTKHLKVHRRAVCPHCGERLTREKTGKRQRWAYFCPLCQQ
jgi:endonuclease-8